MATLPPPVVVDLTEPSLSRYWRDRAAQHTQDSYAGVPISKFPEDLRVYEHLLWLDAPDTVIEVGTQFGGSALWFRDRLRALASYGRIERQPRVITIDIDLRAATDTLASADQEFAREIRLLEADVTDPGLAEKVAAALQPGSRCLVVEDSAHTYETTRAALRSLASFVSPGGFLIVEDGSVDVEALRLEPSWPRGVLAALQEWLQTPEGRQFDVRRSLELYGVSCHPEGFLQRRVS
jgi:cephalosporin hydroxylase